MHKKIISPFELVVLMNEELKRHPCYKKGMQVRLAQLQPAIAELQDYASTDKFIENQILIDIDRRINERYVVRGEILPDNG